MIDEEMTLNPVNFYTCVSNIFELGKLTWKSSKAKMHYREDFKSVGAGARLPRVRILALSFTTQITLGQLLYLSVP